MFAGWFAAGTIAARRQLRSRWTVRTRLDQELALGALRMALQSGFTLGTNIWIAPGAWDPTSIEGMALLAHELYHAQQASDSWGMNLLSYGGDYVSNRLNGQTEAQAEHNIREEINARAMEQMFYNDMKANLKGKRPCEKCEK